ncbi:NlpC/P60 family protein [Halomonas sp. PR-M31]|uniref:NlpC/P60 family protein n=1 Tax=Halomonas sp. PR-M31 TaxID=1471202 RepID=UPI000A541983
MALSLNARCWRCFTLLMLVLLAGCAGREMRMQEYDQDQAELSLERAMILASARQALGIPYRYGGTTTRGLDCSGLVQMAYANAGIDIPRTANQQFSRIPQRDTIRPGDLLFFGSGSKATHVGIYLGDGQMVHAPGRVVMSPPRLLISTTGRIAISVQGAPRLELLLLPFS